MTSTWSALRGEVLLRRPFPSGRAKPYRGVVATLEMFAAEDVVVERRLGTYGIMSISSYSPSLLDASEGLTLSDVDMTRIGRQEIVPGAVETKLYCGRIIAGKKAGTRVLLKAYPGRNLSGLESDMMATNELRTHALLQDPSAGDSCENIVMLLGGFESRTGEQWLVFRHDGSFTVVDYAKAASSALMQKRPVGELPFLERLNNDNVKHVKRRQNFIRKILKGSFNGLSFLHSRGRLHQSLGPASVILNTIEESSNSLVPRLRDFAFSADVSNEALFSGSQSYRDTEALADGLWRRASLAGVRTPFDRRAFGIADDIYSAGFLLAYTVFSSLSKPGSVDGPTLQRIFESTFQLDLKAAREYCQMDERWEEAVRFLDFDDRAGWELLQAMLNANYRQRPIAQAVLCHRFLVEESFQ